MKKWWIALLCLVFAVSGFLLYRAFSSEGKKWKKRSRLTKRVRRKRRRRSFLDTLPRSRIFLNKEPAIVVWLDGDTFHVVDSKTFRGAKARLQGFNTLESYGPVHRWGTWEPKELAANADAATQAARKGVWSCQTHSNKDGYKRILVACPDLAHALLSKGLAHAFSMKDSSPMAFIRVQKEAQRKGAGMWAKGVPNFLPTSIHSHDEKRLKKGGYNRLISTSTGGSEVVSHTNIYKPCQWVCPKSENACMLYVPYRQRFGKNKAACIR